MAVRLRGFTASWASHACNGAATALRDGRGVSLPLLLQIHTASVERRTPHSSKAHLVLVELKSNLRLHE
jgi:hypothetical protein